MRTRLFVITSLVVVAVAGVSSTTAAHAAPKGPGDISQAPATTTPPQQPKDKLAPKPTPTTTVPGPKGPGDLAPAPKDDGDVEPGPDTTGNGSGSDNYVPPATSGGTGETAVNDAAETEVENAEPVASAPAEARSEGFPSLLLILAAAVVGAILALVLSRSRRNDEGVAQL